MLGVVGKQKEEAKEVLERFGGSGGQGLVGKYLDKETTDLLLGSLRCDKGALDDRIEQEMVPTAEVGTQSMGATEPAGVAEKIEQLKASVTEVMRAAVEKVEFVFHY